MGSSSVSGERVSFSWGIAQVVEQLTVNQRVVGSNPTSPAIFFLQSKDHPMKNPYFRAVLQDGTKVDVNLANVNYFTENSDGSTNIVFANGSTLTVRESAQTVRGRTRKAWPEASVEVGA